MILVEVKRRADLTAAAFLERVRRFGAELRFMAEKHIFIDGDRAMIVLPHGALADARAALGLLSEGDRRASYRVYELDYTREIGEAIDQGLTGRIADHGTYSEPAGVQRPRLALTRGWCEMPIHRREP